MNVTILCFQVIQLIILGILFLLFWETRENILQLKKERSEKDCSIRKTSPPGKNVSTTDSSRQETPQVQTRASLSGNNTAEIQRSSSSAASVATAGKPNNSATLPHAILKEKSKKTSVLKRKDSPAAESKISQIFSDCIGWFCVGEKFRNRKYPVEYAVAITWLIRGAILTFLAGIIYFLNYAYRQELIIPELRVAIAVVAGLALLG